MRRLAKSHRIAARSVVLLAAVVLAALLGSAVVARGQPSGSTLGLDTAGDDVRKLLRQIDQMAADGQFDEAVERLRRMMDQRGELLIGVAVEDKDTANAYQRYLPLREICHARLAGWASTRPEALALYRRRVDPLAERWFRQGAEQRDEGLLSRVAEQMFASSYGDDALLRLGELQLEQGRHTAARRSWERISPALRAGPVLRAFDTLHGREPAVHLPGVAGWPLWLLLRKSGSEPPPFAQLAAASAAAKVDAASPAYPDTDLNLADVRARLVMASILEGSFERAEVELEVVRALHAEEQGALAGQSGRYGDLLTALLEEARGWPAPAATADWPTYGGSYARGGEALQGLAPARAASTTMYGRAAWQRTLREAAPSPESELATGARSLFQAATGARPPRDANASLPLSFFPVVVSGRVFVGDAMRILACELQDGRPLRQDGESVVYRSQAQATSAVPTAFTLHSDGRRLLARMGPPPGESPDLKRTRLDHGCLVGFDLRTFKLTFGPIYPEASQWDFEGAPVCDDGRFYALMRKVEGEAKPVGLYIACHDLKSGKQLWRRHLCQNRIGGRSQRLPPALLTLEDDTLYACTNLGCVAAVATDDGAVRWALEYPRATAALVGAEANRSYAPNPCLLHAGIVFAAPADGDRLLAIDATSGELLWHAPRSRAGADHLLGIGHGSLIVGGDSLRWLDTASGGLRGQFPLGEIDERGLARPGPHGYGRGLLSGEFVYWPTRDRIYIFEQRVERAQIVAKPPIDLRLHGIESGNLAVADGKLLIASPTKLYALE